MRRKFSFGMSLLLSCKMFEVYQMVVTERLDMLLSVDNLHSIALNAQTDKVQSCFLGT